MRIVTDKVDRFIRAIVRENTEFIGNSIRYSSIDLEQNILIAVGKIDSGEVLDDAIQSFLFKKPMFNFDSVVEWIDEHKGDAWNRLDIEFKSLVNVKVTSDMLYNPKEQGDNEMALKEIQSVPIFKIGTHNENKFKDDDLNEMIKNFELLRKENPDFQIPIKLGHDAFSDSEKPAVGWMENLRRSGEFIIADFVDLSREAFDLIKNKTFKNRSIEIIPEFVNSLGKKIGKVIKGIALLGSSLPAVNLPDIKLKKALAFSEGQESESYELKDDDFLLKVKDKEDIKMSNEIEKLKEELVEREKLKEELSLARKELSVLAKSKEELVSAKEKLSVLDKFSNSNEIVESLKELKVLKVEKEKSEAYNLKEKAAQDNKFIEDLIEKNKILPKNKDIITSMFSLVGDKDTEVLLEFGVKKKTKLKDMFKDFLNNLPDKGLLNEHSRVKGSLGKDRDKALLNFAEGKGYTEKDVQDLNIEDHKKLLIEFSKEFDS